MSDPDGAQWLGAQLRAAGVLDVPSGDTIADDGPDGPA
jgi:hypothetical protein